MFYYLVPGLMSYRVILIAAAVIPALFLMGKVYRSDRLEKESGALLRSLALAGVMSALIALVAERVLEALNSDSAAGAEKLIETVDKAVRAFTGDAPQFDDVTMLCVVYTGKNKEKRNK